MSMENLDKPTIFVSCRWGDEYQKINDHIRGLIEKAGMTVSEKMEKKGVIPVALKESINIMNSHGFCVIFTPQGRILAPPEVLHEIATARNFRIPTFMFVDKLEANRPEIQGALKGYQGDLNSVGEWFEFRREDLVSGKNDEEIIEYLKAVRQFVTLEYSKIRDRVNSALAAQWAQLTDIEPFHSGMMEITEAYDKEPGILYEAAARAAAKVTGAEFGFIGMLENRDEWMEISINGFYGSSGALEEKAKKIYDALKKIKLGYDYKGKTVGITGYVAQSGEPRIENHIQRDMVKLIGDGVNVVDPGSINIQSELCVPIKIKGRTIGVIDVESTYEDQFQRVHQMLLKWLSGVLAVAYSGEQLETFIGDLSKPSTDKRDLAEKVLKTLMKWSQADYGFIAIMSKGNYHVKSIRGGGLKEDVKERFVKGVLNIKPDAGLAGKVLSTGEAIYSENPEKEAAYLDWFPFVRAEIVLPIKAEGGNTIGVVDLEYSSPQIFKDIDKKLFENLANILAIGFGDDVK